MRRSTQVGSGEVRRSSDSFVLDAERPLELGSGRFAEAYLGRELVDRVRDAVPT
jgi:hypothetical protein